MNPILLFIQNIQVDLKAWSGQFSSLTDLATKLTVIFGGAKFIHSLYEHDFIRKSQEIENNLRFRDRISILLEEYMLQSFKNGNRDIGIRFVHWKNYPWQLKHDGCIHHLWFNNTDERATPSGWINNTGILFQENIWSKGASIYVDKTGIYFVAKSGLKPNGFAELKDKCMIMILSFSKIVNFDFKERTEHVPIFYTRYHHTHDRLFDPIYLVREKSGDPFFEPLKLYRSHRLKKYSWLRSKVLRLKIFLFYRRVQKN